LKACPTILLASAFRANEVEPQASLPFFERRRGLRRREPRLAPWQERLAKQQLSAGIQGTVRIGDVARSCRLSFRHFVTAFTNTVGISPYRWFLERRIARAKQLLSHSELTLAEIALDCGFSDQSHFTKAFSRIAGTTPGSWRRGRHNDCCEVEEAMPMTALPVASGTSVSGQKNRLIRRPAW
jgi:AraC-like DNA-binding protein